MRESARYRPGPDLHRHAALRLGGMRIGVA
jgi:hypothetical protein